MKGIKFSKKHPCLVTFRILILMASIINAIFTFILTPGIYKWIWGIANVILIFTLIEIFFLETPEYLKKEFYIYANQRKKRINR